MLALVVSLYVHALTHGDALAERVLARRTGDRAQSTAEYALVLLGAAAVALLLVAWATKTNKLGKLLDGVLDRVLSHVT